MTIAFINDRVWNAANWVVRAFCDDARPHLEAYPGLPPEIADCLETEFYFINLETASSEVLAQALSLVRKVIADNEARGGADWNNPSFFPGYLNKLRELEALVVEAQESAGAAGSKPMRSEPAAIASSPQQDRRTVDRGRVVVGEARFVTFGRGVFRAHLAADPDARRLVTQAPLMDDVSVRELGRELALEIDGVAPLEYIGPVDPADQVGWEGDCIVEVEPPGRPAIELAPLTEGQALALGLALVALVERAHARNVVIGGIRPELTYLDAASGELTGVAPRATRFLARGRPACAGGPALTNLYVCPADSGRWPSPVFDVFAVCCTLYHLVAGEHPFGDYITTQACNIVKNERRPWPGSAALGEVLIAGLEPDPDARISLADLAARLRRL